MYTLHIGNKNYSSWSLRPWVLMREKGIAFDEHLIPFHDREAWQAYRQHAPNGLVPLLEDDDQMVWDSLAIAEYLAERHPGTWPEQGAARAYARSAAAEMHAGFSNLRNICGMNLGVRARLKERHPALDSELRHLEALWSRGLDRFGGPFLAGSAFSAVDAFFAPVAYRIQTFGLDVSKPAKDYAALLLDLPSMKDWYAAGIAETFRDWPHEDELDAVATITEDLRAAATNERPA